jgi:hypothetical protein
MRKRVSISLTLAIAAGPSAAHRCATVLAVATILVAASGFAVGAAEGTAPSAAALEERTGNAVLAVRPNDGPIQVQPKAHQFVWPNRPDVSPTEAKELDKLYRQLMSRRTPAGAPPLSGFDAR